MEHTLGADDLAAVLGHLTDIRDIGRAFSVCKTWSALDNIHDNIWQKTAQETWPAHQQAMDILQLSVLTRACRPGGADQEEDRRKMRAKRFAQATGSACDAPLPFPLNADGSSAFHTAQLSGMRSRHAQETCAGAAVERRRKGGSKHDGQ